MRNELKTRLTWATLNPPVVIEDFPGGNIFANYKIAFDNWGNTYAVIQGYLDPNDTDYDIADDNFLCIMTDNKDDEFCGQGGYNTVAEAVEAVEFIAANGEAPRGFFAC